MTAFKRPAHYNIYPVQPVEISKYLGFCLGNVVKYILRSPFKGTPQDDCQKALEYLAWEMESPHESTPVHDLGEALDAISRLREYLVCEVKESKMQDSYALYTQHFLNELEAYLSSGASEHLKQMQATISRLQTILVRRADEGETTA